MRAIKSLLGLALGLGLGAAASYALLRWLSAQSRSTLTGSGAPTEGAVMGLVGQTQGRIRAAVAEGRRAAAEARAELEAEAYGRPTSAEPEAII